MAHPPSTPFCIFKHIEVHWLHKSCSIEWWWHIFVRVSTCEYIRIWGWGKHASISSVCELHSGYVCDILHLAHLLDICRPMCHSRSFSLSLHPWIRAIKSKRSHAWTAENVKNIPTIPDGLSDAMQCIHKMYTKQYSAKIDQTQNLKIENRHDIFFSGLLIIQFQSMHAKSLEFYAHIIVL